ncbi:MAG TPA: formyl transferase, partial [Hyphomicrobiaceae bacterium]|nr:formyl transferase [Hyphomicrobiaceae bacterium]
WQPHPGNPLVTDARRARPAGELFREGGRLYRPVQDCSGGYGSALAINEIERLDTTGFRERQVLHTRFAPSERTLGPHTLNVVGDFELIDLFGPRQK